MGGWYSSAKVDLSGMERLQEKLDNYGSEAQVVVAKYLATEALDQVGPAISRLLPVSGRTFAGHQLGARAAGYRAVFMTAGASVDGVTIRSAPEWGYLYFPDDGKNTKRHRGNQKFMVRGAQTAAPDIANEICTRLVQKFEEG
ncbi:MAG: hypothetical protein LUD78_08145 [Clostridiales bacterium]|nr:hypothetical protein [Clostridiales bacterium]